jgi:long-chain acyl-CoA synthetase
MNIARFLAASARSFPDRPAISVGSEPYANYARFFDRVTRLAAGFRALPRMKPGDRIGLAMKN